MSKEYSQQQVSSFFQQFKKLENTITIEKVHLIINDPNAKARYKVKSIKPLNLIIMTFIVSISIVLLYLFSSPAVETRNISVQQTVKKEKHISNEVLSNEAKTDELSQENTIIIENKKETETFENRNTIEEKPEKLVTELNKLSQADTSIDGSQFILELTNDELEKLGFKINHYSVYYRNSYNNKNVFYLATHTNGRFSVRADSLFYNLSNDYNEYPIEYLI